MRTKYLVLIMLAVFISKNICAYECAFKDFKGARRENPETGNWEVAWEVTRSESENSNLLDIKGLQGVLVKRFDKTSKGNQKLSFADLGISSGSGFELPLLGIKSDFWIMAKYNLNSPVRYYADDGTIAQEWWNRGFYPYWAGGNQARQLAWFKSEGSNAERIKREKGPQYAMTVRTAPFDSRWLDSNNNGYWLPELAMKIRNYQLPVTLAYVIILPATTVDIPMQKDWQGGAKLEFEYLATNKETRKAEILLDPEYFPQKGNLRIGFVNMKYIVQNPGRGKEGIVIGRLDDVCKNGRLTIIPKSLKIEKAKWIPYDRIHVNKRKWIGEEGSPDNDFSAFDSRPNRDWGYLMSIRGFGKKAPGRNFPLRNEFNRISRDQAVREKKDTLRIVYKYGMRIALDIGDQTSTGNVIPEQYKAEDLDPETKKFVKTEYLDWANPEAAAWERENLKRRLTPFRGAVTYVIVHEGWGVIQSNNKSLYALKNFRDFVNDQNAKFPVVPTSPNTDRTTNKPSPELIEKYKLWKLGYFRGKVIMLGHLGGAYEAFQGSGHFKGVGYFGHVSDNGGYFVPYLGQSEKVALLCPEIVIKSTQASFQPWLEASRNSNGRIVLLPHSYPMLITHSTERFIEWFEDIGLRPEVRGLLLGGGGLVPKSLFDALAAKHFGRGRMTIEEADRRISIAKDKGIFHLDNYSEKEMQYHLRNFSRSKPLNIKTASRTPAIQKSIKVDGNLADWQGATWVKLKGDKNMLFKKDYDGSEDLGCSFSIAYDADNLYLAAKVRDDKIVSRNMTLSETADEINLFVGFVQNPVKDKIIFHHNAYQFRIFPSQKFKAVYLGHTNPEKVLQSRVAYKKTEDGYLVEVSISFKQEKFTPVKGNLLPLDLYLIDADEEGGAPSAGMVWNMFKDKKAPWKTPQQWGVVEFK